MNIPQGLTPSDIAVPARTLEELNLAVWVLESKMKVLESSGLVDKDIRKKLWAL